MSEVVSTIRLIADTSQALTALKAIDKLLDEFGKGKNELKLNLNDADTKKYLNDLKKSLEYIFNDKNISKVFSSEMTNDLQSSISKIFDEITRLGNMDVSVGAKADFSEVYAEIENVRSIAKQMLNVDLAGATVSSNVLGVNSSKVSISDEADDAEKEYARLANAMARINNLMTRYSYENMSSQLYSNWQKTANAYGDFGSESAQKNMQEATAALEEYQEIYSKLASITDINGNIDLRGLQSLFSDEEILALANSMSILEDRVTHSLSEIKREADDAGFQSLSKNFDTFDKSVEAVSKSLGNSDFDKQMSGIQKMLDSYSNVDTDKMEDVRKQFADLQQDLQDLQDCYDKDTGTLDINKLFGEKGWDESKLENFSTSLKNVTQETKNATSELKNLGVDNNLLGKMGDGTYKKQIDDLHTSISKLSDSDAKASLTQSVQGIDELYSKMQSSATLGTAEGLQQASEYARELQTELAAATTQMDELNSSGSSGTFMTNLSGQLNSIGQFVNRAIGYQAIYREIRQVAKDMVSTVEEVDSAMVQLQIVTGASESEMDTFFESAIVQAKELGQSVTDVLDSIQVYSRLGYDLADSSELAEYTAILSNVAAVDVDEATTGLTSVIKGFDMEVSEAEHVADVLIDIGQNYAVSASEILEAFTRSSAAFGATGTTFEEASAIIAAGLFAKICQRIAEMQFNRTHLIARTS